MSQPWKQDLCGCFNHPKVSLSLIFCYPCASCYITYNNFKILVDDSSGKTRACLSCFFPLIAHTFNRSTIRNIVGIEGSCIGDCFTHLFCNCCALVQEFNEAELSQEGYKGMKEF